jgi:hypothetical protein
MTTYNTNLHVNYCSDWGFWEAIREIIQNAVDQETINPENEFDINYNELSKELIISNKNSTLDRSSILMGNTSKKNQVETIGSHGEGYKVALLVLSRLGNKVKIKNYKKNEIWTPRLIKDKKYDNLSVLKIEVLKYIFKKLPDNNLTWTISNVSKTDFEKVKNNFLHFDKNIDSYDSSGNKILFNKKYKGMVFVKGIFIEKQKEDFHYGYDLSPSKIILDRDRRSVDTFELRYISSGILSEYGNLNSKNMDLLLDLVKNSAIDVSLIDIIPNRAVGKSIVAKFEKSNGLKSYPVSNQSEFDEIKDLNLDIKPVIVNREEKSLILKDDRFISFWETAKRNNSSKGQLQTPTEILKSFSIEAKHLDPITKRNLKKIIELSSYWTNKKELSVDIFNEKLSIKEPEDLDIPF